jgi:hypothetical protein
MVSVTSIQAYYDVESAYHASHEEQSDTQYTEEYNIWDDFISISDAAKHFSLSMNTPFNNISRVVIFPLSTVGQSSEFSKRILATHSLHLSAISDVECEQREVYIVTVSEIHLFDVYYHVCTGIEWSFYAICLETFCESDTIKILRPGCLSGECPTFESLQFRRQFIGYTLN